MLQVGVGVASVGAALGGQPVHLPRPQWGSCGDLCSRVLLAR